MKFMDPAEWGHQRARASRSLGAPPGAGAGAAPGQLPWKAAPPGARSRPPPRSQSRGMAPAPWGQHGSAAEAAAERAARVRAAAAAARSPTPVRAPPNYPQTQWPVVPPKGGLTLTQPAREPRPLQIFMRDIPGGHGAQLPEWLPATEAAEAERQQQAARAAAKAAAAEAAGGQPPPPHGQPSADHILPGPPPAKGPGQAIFHPPPRHLTANDGQPSEPSPAAPAAAANDGQPSEPRPEPGPAAPVAAANDGQPSEPGPAAPAAAAAAATGHRDAPIEISSDEENVNLPRRKAAKIPNP